jgi:hypothetical protein
MSEQSLDLDAPAFIWTSAIHTPREAQKARVKVKILCGVLRLRVHDHLWSRGKSSEVAPTCLMCSIEAENRAHFLLRCPALRDIRDPQISKVYDTLALSTGTDTIPEEMLLQLLLDPTHPSCQVFLRCEEEATETVEAISRELIFRMYKRRLDLLDFRPAKQRRKQRANTTSTLREDQS